MHNIYQMRSNSANTLFLLFPEPGKTTLRHKSPLLPALPRQGDDDRSGHRRVDVAEVGEVACLGEREAEGVPRLDVP